MDLKKLNAKSIVTYLAPILISGGTTYGTMEVKQAILEQRIEELESEKEVLFRIKANKEVVENEDTKLLKAVLNNGEKIGDTRDRVSKVEAKIEVYH